MKTDIWSDDGLLCSANIFSTYILLSNLVLQRTLQVRKFSSSSGVGGKIEKRGSGSVLLPNGGAGGGFSPKSYFPATTSEMLHRLKTVPKGDKCPSFSPCTAESSNSRTSFRIKKEVTAEAFLKNTPLRTNTRYHLVSKYQESK